MKMRDKRYSLIVIILLLVIFLPLTVLGYIYKENNKVEENPNHEFFYEGKLWFYDENDTYISKYECLNKVCELAKSSIDDEDESINYYKEGEEDTLNIISNSYAFIQDGDLIKLYDINHGRTIVDYLKVKNYSTTLSDNIYILENKNNLWGVLYIKDVINEVIPFEYEFIGLKNEIDSNNYLLANKYIVKKDNWYLLDSSNKKLSSEFENTIVDYNDKYIVTYNDNQYKLYSYQKEEYLANQNIDKYLFENKYIGIINDNILYIYNDLNNEPGKIINITSKDLISLKYTNNVLYIYENNAIIDSYR